MGPSPAIAVKGTQMRANTLIITSSFFIVVILKKVADSLSMFALYRFNIPFLSIFENPLINIPFTSSRIFQIT